MICIFIGLFFTFLISLLFGFIILTPYVMQGLFSILFIGIPMDNIATIETFIEIGLIINALLWRFFKYNTFIKILGVLLVIALGVLGYLLGFTDFDLPIMENLYYHIWRFFHNIINKIEAKIFF